MLYFFNQKGFATLPLPLRVLHCPMESDGDSGPEGSIRARPLTMLLPRKLAEVTFEVYWAI